MKLVIVESPAKAKTINRYLGSDYRVLASYGHVRDLPAKNGSVLPDDDFAMVWTTAGKSREHLLKISSAVRDADSLILATDPDREGEAISWHILESLRAEGKLPDLRIERVVFNAITKSAILEAMAQPREIDHSLVDAYLARRSLDYLVGFTLSPVLWRKLPSARSAGRVQSVALRLVCEREDEIEAFIPQEYWSIIGNFSTRSGDSFEARISSFGGDRLQQRDIADGDRAGSIKSALESSTFTISSIDSKPVKRNPYAPFTTSTLQQDASGKLRFSASRTMQIAQKLYEGIDIGGETVGLITYMRTDGVQMASEAITQARDVIRGHYGDRHLPEKPRIYKSKAKNAQEAHEAVRPTDLSRLPKSISGYLTTEQSQLYELIWNRTIASQMSSAEIERTTVELDAKSTDSGSVIATMRATGSVIRFEGFLSVYKDTPRRSKPATATDDKAPDSKPAKDSDDDRRLPELNTGESVNCDQIISTQHFTEPPARYSEASLIKKMEELGIGRPSTYASTLATLSTRGYVEIDQRRMTPVASGRLLTSFLENFFERYVEYDFTADLEEKLDLISDGKLQWKSVLREFWQAFSLHIGKVSELSIRDVLDELNVRMAPLAFPAREDGSDPRVCPLCSDGKLSLKTSRYGTFIGCENYPDCKFTRQLGQSDSDALIQNQDKVLGTDPDTGEEIQLKSGRFGPYVERGDGKDAKRFSVPKDWSPAQLDLSDALRLLSLPRFIGEHPETGKIIETSIGPHGPYLRHGGKNGKGGKYATLDSIDDVFTIGINLSVTKLAEAALKPRRGSASILKDLGEHPETGRSVTVRVGRYGPYVKHGKINAMVPATTDPQSVELDLAIDLLTAREERMANKTEKKTKSKKPAKKSKKKAEVAESLPESE